MCVILICPSKVRPNEATLLACAAVNPDGIGIAWRENAGVRWKKNLNTSEAAKLIGILSGEIVIHFRLASIGGVHPRLCHPFPVDRIATTALQGQAPRVLFHNGTWSGYGRGLHWLEENLGCQPPKGPVSDSRVAARLVHHLGSSVLHRLPGRFVVMGAKTTKVFGQWQQWEGMKVSNSFFVRALRNDFVPPIRNQRMDEANTNNKPKKGKSHE